MNNDVAKDNRKLQIIRAARALLAGEGETGFSLREVAKGVGIKLASLQYHFPTRAKLVEAILQHTHDAYVSELNALPTDTDADPTEKLRSALKWFTSFESGDEEENHLEIHLWSMALSDPLVRESLTLYHRSYIDKVTELIAAANPTITQSDARCRAVAIVSMQEGSLLFANGEAAQLPQSEILEQLYLASLQIALG